MDETFNDVLYRKPNSKLYNKLEEDLGKLLDWKLDDKINQELYNKFHIELHRKLFRELDFKINRQNTNGNT